jgi:hypothetical protein
MQDYNKNKKLGIAPLGVGLTLLIAIILGYNLFKGDKAFFLAGDTSHGHYQIELECDACHSGAFSEPEEMQQACESCHAKELDKVGDSHPKKLFSDPRNADLLEKLDARQCVACHREHKPEITRDFGVTLASDFCFHCHQDIAEERPSHEQLEFSNCTNSGCHNYHDNSMLYEKFLSRNLDQPAQKEVQLLPSRTGLERWLKKHKKLAETNADISIADVLTEPNSKLAISVEQATHDWLQSAHAKTQGNCSDCHNKQTDVNQNTTIKTPLTNGYFELSAADMNQNCGSCHKKQSAAFIESKHGMRLAQGLSAMQPSLARGDIHQLNDKPLSCASCHHPHSLEVQQAAVSACLDCHQDQHSKAYLDSKHYKLWQQELSGELPEGSGVSCASCHLPRHKKGKRVEVIHNQNLNLRPNSKMLRKVCMNCHGLAFSLAALADEPLIQTNFNGVPKDPHRTIQLIKDRQQQKSTDKP